MTDISRNVTIIAFNVGVTAMCCRLKKMFQELLYLQWKLIFFVMHMILTTLCVPDELLLNGGFATQSFVLPTNKSEILIDKSKNKIPHWTISNGSIEVISSRYFYPDSTSWNRVGNYCIHMNSEKGPGTIHSSSLLGQMAGAVYNISIVVAGSPRGGELYKKMQMTVIFRRRFFFWLFTEHKYSQYNASNPYESITKIPWMTKMYTYIGTGRETRIKIASMSGGSDGFLIDNVHVSLHNILDNGSFEQLSTDVTNVFLDSDIVNSPSWKIKKWYLESGSIKYIRGRLQPATDHSGTAIDLNGNEPGLLSRNVSTINKEYYYISFDYAANPEAGKRIKGYFSLTVYSENDDKSSIQKKWMWVTNKGCTKTLVGWRTSIIGFYAKSNSTFIKFESTIKGMFGPLLDNVQMYQYTTPFSTSTTVGTLSCSQLATLLTGVWLLLLILGG